jgi:hypothetical protein
MGHRRSNPRASIIRPPAYSDEELRLMYDRLIKTKQPPDIVAIPSLRHWVEEQMKIAAIEYRYQQAAEFEEADLMLERFLENGDGGAAEREEKRKTTSEKLNIVKEKTRSAIEKWAEKIETWKADQAERFATLENAHRQQLEEFERQWADPSYLGQFNKPSARLLALRQAESNLAIAKNFKAAHIAKVHADRMEEQEAIAGQHRAIVALRAEYKILELKQKKERNCFHEFTNRIISVMEKDRDREIGPMKLVSERLATILDDRQIEVKKSRSPSPRPLHGIRSNRPRSLGLAGIQVRSHIRVRRFESRPSQKALQSVYDE